jgi:hypothetical protein
MALPGRAAVTETVTAMCLKLHSWVEVGPDQSAGKDAVGQRQFIAIQWIHQEG